MKTMIIAAAAAAFALPVLAEPQISIEDPYARAAGKSAKAGAAFMTIVNAGDEDDRLIGAKADISRRVELHTHIEGDGGIMRMVEVEEGFAVPAGASHALARGGDHVMFMGLTGPLEHGDTVPVTLIFEKSGEIAVEIPVDLERKGAMDGQGMQMGKGNGQGDGQGNGPGQGNGQGNGQGMKNNQ